MNHVNLKSLIYKNYLKTALTSILFIEIALIAIYFNANDNMVKASVNFILKDIKKSVYHSVNNATIDVEHKFRDIENFLQLLQNEQENFFKYYNKVDIFPIPQFKRASNGMYYKNNDNGGSSVIVSKNTIITQKVKDKLLHTETFDKNFKSVVDNNEMVVAAYFNSFDNINRYYPFITDSFSAFPADITMQNYNFYYQADLKHNPEKKVVWTDVYLDPAGQGWMLSAIVPIYNKDFLEGVTGLDITVEKIIKSFLDFKLPYNGSSFLINEHGKIIALTKEVAQILHVKDFKKYIYSKNETVNSTVYDNNGVNILDYKNKAFVSTIKKILTNTEYSEQVTLHNQNYLIFSQKIERTGWHIISMIDENNIVSEVRELEEYYLKLGYVIVALIVVFYFIFFLYLYVRAKKFVKVINKPLTQIINLTKDLGRKKDIKKLEPCGIEEIDILSENFNNLSIELDERTKKLLESEIIRERNEKLANTDAMTNVYNRRFLEDFASKYLQIVKREDHKISMLLIDIDNFKTINDTYGHDLGDKIIIEFARILKDNIRENDLIVRYGGDEFVVLLPNTNLKNAHLVGEKINHHINKINTLKSKELQFTISVGCSEYEKADENIDELIKRADIALYKAKTLGRNRVVS